MKRALLVSSCIFIAALLCAQTEQPQTDRREVGNLVMEGIPDIPQATQERMNQYQNVRHAYLVDWEPSTDGLLIATRLGESYQLHHVSSPGADRQQITFYKEPVDSAWYCPDKQRNGFLFNMDVGGGEFYQIYWFDLNTGKHTLLTDGGESVNDNPLWSNSGKKIVFGSTKRNQKDFDLYLMNGIDPKSTQLLKQTEGYWAAADWSADDSLVLLMNYIAADDSRLHIINPKTKAISQINASDKKISYGSFAFARDRNGVYYTSDEDSEFIRLTYYDLSTGKKEILTPDLKWDVSELAVSKDGKWIAYSTNEGGVSKVYLAPTS
ncbi:MAG TPA: DPP IV N-terminal domain-containing protein, partial [Acidobacteriota bacterium]|nr:DPP IV N-terminal domain-containing protein [Acidobacteriota bacterium]